MPVPNTITNMGNAAYQLPNINKTINNPKDPGTRPTLTYTLHPYLEVACQSKHDATMRGYCLQNHIQPRPQAGSQVPNPNNWTANQMLSNFYPARAETAADVVMAKVSAALAKNTPAGTVAIPIGQQIDAAVQAIMQADGYRYELSYWYDTRDIYLLFHCYPG